MGMTLKAPSTAVSVWLALATTPPPIFQIYLSDTYTRGNRLPPRSPAPPDRSVGFLSPAALSAAEPLVRRTVHGKVAIDDAGDARANGVSVMNVAVLGAG